MTYLISNNKADCTGCGACQQICGRHAITMEYDKEEFAYPVINSQLCINCGACVKICPLQNKDKLIKDRGKEKFEPRKVFGGSHKDTEVLKNSTSGGAFTAFCQAWAKQNDFVIYGAFSHKLDVRHIRLTNIVELKKICKSKYRQSDTGNCFDQVRQDLKKGKKVLFSGTPCQIGGLKSYLGSADQSNLLTIEVVCEGVPSPLFIKKLVKYLSIKSDSELEYLDYRCKKKKKFGSRMKWDFQIMQASFRSGHIWDKDRWFNPFWNIWLKHLMSRPSCYECIYTRPCRVADITLGDLWGVHLYCPDLYNHNKGASLIICNTDKGSEWLNKAICFLDGHELDPNDAIKYQTPLRKTISYNPDRESFMADLEDNNVAYEQIVKKWYTKPNLKLVFSKYLWGNRNKIWLWRKLKQFKINYMIK